MSSKRPTFSTPVSAALTFTASTQAAEIAALTRLAGPGGWLMTRPEVTRKETT